MSYESFKAEKMAALEAAWKAEYVATFDARIADKEAAIAQLNAELADLRSERASLIPAEEVAVEVVSEEVSTEEAPVEV